MFSFLKEKLQKVYTQITLKLGGLFGRKQVDETVLNELERILLEADTGLKTTRSCIEDLRIQMQQGKLSTGIELKQALSMRLKEILHQKKYQQNSSVILLVGVNGTGKTTFAAKLAQAHIKAGKKVLLAAADTFRAAATEQLARWAERSGADLITGTPGQDPAAVVFNACQRFTQEKYDVLIIDTAGRLQTKSNLMRELEKVRTVIKKQLPEKQATTLLTVDAMLGQNSFDQATLFNEATQLDAIVLTKMDGTGKGGIVFAISQELRIPIAYVSYGEGIEEIKYFDPDEYVQQLLEA